MTDQDGWIKLWRKIQDSDMYLKLNSKQRDVLMQCLLLANHKEKEWEWKGKLYKCQQGQFITSLPKLQKKCAKDVSIRNIRTSLLKLETWGFLANESTGIGRLITIVNWVKYQSEEKKLTDKLTDKRQTTDRLLTANKKGKKGEKGKKTIHKEKIIEKRNFAEFVRLSEEEYKKLTEKYGEVNVKLMIEKLDNYKGSTGKPYKSDYRTILSWVAKEVLGNPQKKGGIDLSNWLPEK